MAGGGPEAGAGDALGDDVAREGGAGIEPRVPTAGALRTEAATVAAIREALACEGEVAAPSVSIIPRRRPSKKRTTWLPRTQQPVEKRIPPSGSSGMSSVAPLGWAFLVCAKGGCAAMMGMKERNF